MHAHNFPLKHSPHSVHIHDESLLFPFQYIVDYFPHNQCDALHNAHCIFHENQFNSSTSLHLPPSCAESLFFLLKSACFLPWKSFPKSKISPQNGLISVAFLISPFLYGRPIVEPPQWMNLALLSRCEMVIPFLIRGNVCFLISICSHGVPEFPYIMRGALAKSIYASKKSSHAYSPPEITIKIKNKNKSLL